MRQRSSLLKAVITAFPSVSLPFLAVPLRSHRTVAIRSATVEALLASHDLRGTYAEHQVWTKILSYAEPPSPFMLTSTA
eukprot:SAG22_NODE_1555_length_4133_cov_3.586515_4_plen_79_part_00